ASISLSRNTASYRSRPRLRSQAQRSMMGSQPAGAQSSFRRNNVSRALFFAVTVWGVDRAIDEDYCVHSFAADDAGARAQAGQCLDDQWEAIGQVIARTAVQPHAIAILPGDGIRRARFRAAIAPEGSVAGFETRISTDFVRPESHSHATQAAR